MERVMDYEVETAVVILNWNGRAFLGHRRGLVCPGGFVSGTRRAGR